MQNVTIFHIGALLGIAAVVYGVVQAFFSMYSRKGEIYRSHYFLVTTLEELREKSSGRSLVLITDTASRGHGARSAQREFENDIMPKILDSAKKTGILICWGNLAGNDIANWLEEKKLKKRGCFVIRDGVIVEHVPFDFLASDVSRARTIETVLTRITTPSTSLSDTVLPAKMDDGRVPATLVCSIIAVIPCAIGVAMLFGFVKGTTGGGLMLLALGIGMGVVSRLVWRGPGLRKTTQPTSAGESSTRATRVSEPPEK